MTRITLVSTNSSLSNSKRWRRDMSSSCRTFTVSDPPLTA